MVVVKLELLGSVDRCIWLAEIIDLVQWCSFEHSDVN